MLVKTFVYKLVDLEDSDKMILEFYQKRYSTAFRKLYSNFELHQDKKYLNSLCLPSTKWTGYLVKEVEGMIKSDRSELENLIKSADELESNIKEFSLKPSKEKKEIHNEKEKKCLSYKYKILNQRKQQNKTDDFKWKDFNKNKDFEKLVELRRNIKRKTIFGGYNNHRLLQKGKITIEEWKEKRLLPMCFYGETSRSGNRFFDFKGLSNGNIKFKLEGTTVKMDLKFLVKSGKKRKDELFALEQLALTNAISITIKLSHDKICITFDESILNNSKMDYRKLAKDMPLLVKNDVQLKKDFWSQKHREHEADLKRGKLERYITIDSNPNVIGFTITERDGEPLKKGSYEIVGKKIDHSKRKYELSQIIKRLFVHVKHYKVSYFGIEDLDIKDKNYGNKTSNRLIKNEWCKNYIERLVTKRCFETKTILRKVNPVYSSFIGNLQNRKLYDPIASAVELNRRVIGQYEKGFKFYPDLTDDIIKYAQMNLNDQSLVIHSWKELFDAYRNKSYRCKEKSLLGVLSSKRSHVCLYI